MSKCRNKRKQLFWYEITEIIAFFFIESIIIVSWSIRLTVLEGFSMTNEKVYQMSFSKVYALLIAKVEKKGRTRDEIDQVTCWMTGYSKENLEELLEKDIAYGDFFLNAPELNPNRKLIKGRICGVRVEKIEEPLMQEIRYLDKLVDELAKGKAMEKILRKE